MSCNVKLCKGTMLTVYIQNIDGTVVSFTVNLRQGMPHMPFRDQRPSMVRLLRQDFLQKVYR